MLCKLFITSAAVLVCGAAALAQEGLGNPLGGLETLKDFEARRASSCQPDWRNTNGDAITIAAGETAVIADLQGPGTITHIWFTISHAVAGYPRLLTLRMYWDGEEHPSVECPVGDFFVIGNGMDRAFESIPVMVSSEGRARNCYWPMPFRRSARITVTNDSSVDCRRFFYYVDWRKHDSLPADAAYFHAMYRQEFPCVMGRNYLIADIEGRGHYVGTVQSVYHSDDGWYGEGDDFWFIDGEEEPSLRGTGTEDYFCDAWGFREFDGPFYGVPVWEGRERGARGTAYRFHLTDPVPFRKSLRVDIEHKGSARLPDGKNNGFIERDDLMSSVAFWYQLEPHKPWPALPPGPDRLPATTRDVVQGEDLIEGALHTEAPLLAQKVAGTRGGSQLWFKPATEDAWVEVPFELAEEAEGYLSVWMVHSHDYGVYEASLDGKSLGAWDLWLAPTPTATEHSVGYRKLSPGRHALRFRCRGRNASSTGFYIGFDALTMVVPAYLRAPGVDLRDLQVERRELPGFLTDRQVDLSQR